MFSIARSFLMTKRLQQDALERSEYLSEIALTYRNGAMWPKARGKHPLLCPHCQLAGTMTPFTDKQSFWTHINSVHHAPSVSQPANTATQLPTGSAS